MTFNKMVENHYRSFAPGLIQQASRFCQKADAEDIVQETYRRVLEYRETFEGTEKDFPGWVYGIFANCARAHRNTELRHGMTNDEAGTDTTMPVEENRLTLGQIEAHINAMPAGTKRLVGRLFFIKNLPYKSIYAVADATPANVRKLVQLIREELKERFG